MSDQSFSANGKLLLTGEYLVLKGAVALALPTRLGQTLIVQKALGEGEWLPFRGKTTCHERSVVEATQPDPNLLYWSAYQPSGPWFSATLHPDTLAVLHTDDAAKAAKLSETLQAVRALNPQAFEPGLRFTTLLGFDPEWGLGSSSTLVSLLAQWAEVDPYELLRNTFGGSGYDIACATADTPIHYRLEQGEPQWRPVAFHPPFADRLFFVYQGRKQRSSEAVSAFNRHWEKTDLSAELQTVSELSMALPTITYFEDFCTLLEVHERLLSRCLDRPPVQTLFPDFEGSLKSLGAWGGDFLLAATPWPYEQVGSYFRSKGLEVVLPYDQLIVQPTQ